MKRIIALLLSVLLVIGCSVIGVSAQSDKLHPDLEVLLQKKAPDDDVSVYITYAIAGKSVADMPSWPDRAAANAEYKEYRLAKQAEIQSVIFDGLEVTVLNTIGDNSVIAYVKAKDIAVLAPRDLVAYISYIDLTIEEEPESAETMSSTEAKLLEYVKGKGAMPPYYTNYEELYTHQNAEGETDWVLLYSLGEGAMPWYVCGVYHHRVILRSEEWSLFALGIGLYDAKEDTFYDLAKMRDYDKYEGLAEAIDACGKGKLLGDLDNDDDISIADCTILQRCEAALCEYPQSDLVGSYSYKYEDIKTPLRYYSDFNRDGERSIIDVTCMQRYLAGMTYPVG